APLRARAGSGDTAVPPGGAPESGTGSPAGSLSGRTPAGAPLQGGRTAEHGRGTGRRCGKPGPGWPRRGRASPDRRRPGRHASARGPATGGQVRGGGTDRGGPAGGSPRGGSPLPHGAAGGQSPGAG